MAEQCGVGSSNSNSSINSKSGALPKQSLRTESATEDRVSNNNSDSNEWQQQAWCPTIADDALRKELLGSKLS